MPKAPILPAICTLLCLLAVNAQSLPPHQKAANDAQVRFLDTVHLERRPDVKVRFFFRKLSITSVGVSAHAN